MRNNKLESPQKPYIMLAEDDIDDRLVFQEAFNELNMNLQLVIVNNGEELINYLSEKAILLPQLVFLDLNMPFKNGFECLHELKRNEKLKDIPVIIYSTSGSGIEREKCRQLKAHLYITKPSSFTRLKKIINKILIMDFVDGLVEEPKEKFLIFS
jgi:CheY-like chemotaxis protein